MKVARLIVRKIEKIDFGNKVHPSTTLRVTLADFAYCYFAYCQFFELD